jgi:D-alanyl-D-alanine carboxypeptidase (penicillin-binding protein 5/6)
VRRLIGLVSLLTAFVAAAPALAAGAAGGTSSPATPPSTPTTVAPVTTADGSTRAAGTLGLPSVMSARSWLVADADTGAVLATRDPHAPMPPASTLKLLTALALRPVLPANGWAVPSAQAVGVTGSKAHLDQGARYSITDLLRTMLIISANDAAETLAGAAGGDAHAVSLMAAEAKHLGANDTVPVDPTGLDAPQQQSSAYDLALIGRAVLRDPVLAGIVSSAHSSFTDSHGQNVPLTNHNKLLTDYPGAIGLKTGYTSEAGATYVGAARRGGHTILIVLLHARENLWPEVHALLDWGFTADAAGAAHPVLTLAEPKPIPAAAAGHAQPAKHLDATATTKHSSHSGLPGKGTDIAVAITLLAVGYTVLSERRRRRGRPAQREPLVISRNAGQRRAWRTRRASSDAVPTASTPAPTAPAAREARSEVVAGPEGDIVVTLPEGVDPFADTIELPAVRVPAGAVGTVSTAGTAGTGSSG